MGAVLSKGRPFKFKASGTSMRPLIQSGDLLTVSPSPAGSLTVGDVAAVKIPGSERVVVHRVIEKDGEKVLIQGDAGKVPEGLFDAGAVLGKVTRVERNGKKVWFGCGWFQGIIVFLIRARFLGGIILPAIGIFNGAGKLISMGWRR
jgi:signal peptidase I